VSAPAASARSTRKRAAKAKPAGKDYSSIAAEFEEDVLAGRFPAGQLFRAAIEKQRREIADPPKGYVFSAAEGDKVCRRAERFPFHEGPKRGQPFELQPWQVWQIRTLFGWIDPTTGWRRFREASIWEPKGNGKSPFAALVALCVMTVATGGDKGYSAASAQKQSRLVFDAAREMLRIDADNAAAQGRKAIRDHFGLVVEEHRIKGAGDGRVYEPVSSEAGTIEGIRPFFLILDEVHVLPNRKLYDNLQSAANKVDGSLFVTISTAGMDMSPQSLGWNLYCRARDIILGRIDEPTTFALIIEADRKRPDGSDADPADFEVWRQANPNLGVSVSIAGLQKAMRTWRDQPSERPSLEVKHLGWWQQSANAFLDVRRWNALGDPTLKLEDLSPDEGWEIHVGIDLARTRDLTAAPVVASRPREDGKREYRIYTRWVYLPEESVTLTQTPAMKEWAKAGWLVLVPGETMTFRPLTAAALTLLERFPVVTAAVDDWMAGEVENDLMSGGVEVVSIRQGAKTQSEPMKELESAMLDGRLVHDASPLTSWCAGNLLARADRNGNIAPDRENETKKIDPMVAIINALVLARSGAEAHAGDLLM
jgi:phage terminase large subunit-like protein